MEDETLIDRWHDGYFANLAGLKRPIDPVAAEGWQAREHAKGVAIVQPSRPEGYYHMPIGSFE